MHTMRVVAMMRAFGSVGESGPMIVLSRRVFLPLLASMKPRGSCLGNGCSKACPMRVLPLLWVIAASECYD